MGKSFLLCCLWFCLVAVEKPGECPVIERSGFGVCVEECSSDSDCESDLKCCSNGCGHVCHAALQIGMHDWIKLSWKCLVFPSLPLF